MIYPFKIGYFDVYFRTFVVIIFRLLPAIFLGDGIYGDEQDEFECVGTQPGCRNMCFTEFSPMQPPRMWCLQILLSCVPPVIFNFYAARQTAHEKILIFFSIQQFTCFNYSNLQNLN